MISSFPSFSSVGSIFFISTQLPYHPLSTVFPIPPNYWRFNKVVSAFSLFSQ